MSITEVPTLLFLAKLPEVRTVLLSICWLVTWDGGWSSPNPSWFPGPWPPLEAVSKS